MHFHRGCNLSGAYTGLVQGGGVMRHEMVKTVEFCSVEKVILRLHYLYLHEFNKITLKYEYDDFSCILFISRSLV